MTNQETRRGSRFSMGTSVVLGIALVLSLGITPAKAELAKSVTFPHSTATVVSAKHARDADGSSAQYVSALESLYQAMYATANAAMPNATTVNSLATPASFNASVAATPASALEELESRFSLSDVTQAVGVIAPVVPTVRSLARAHHVKLVRAHNSLKPGVLAITRHAHAVTVTSALVVLNDWTPMPTPDGTLSDGQAPLTYANDPSGNTYTASCPNLPGTAPNAVDAIFGLQIVIDAAQLTYNITAPIGGLLTVVGESGPPSPSYYVSIVSAAILAAAQIAHDALSYEQALGSACSGNNAAAVGVSTLNTSYETYQLLTKVAATTNEIDTNVANLTNQVSAQFNQQLTLSIEQALSAPTGSVPMAAMELPQSLGGYLVNDAAPGGGSPSALPSVAGVVSSTIAAMQGVGQPMNPQATRNFNLAQQAEESGQYKLAFAEYALSYQAAAG